MNINTEYMVANEVRKVGLLINEASRLGMDLSGYGEVDVNKYTGNVYIWLEDYPFALFIDLGSDDIQACWSDFDSGNEEFILTNKWVDMKNVTMSLDDLYKWCEDNANNELYNEIN